MLYLEAFKNQKCPGTEFIRFVSFDGGYLGIKSGQLYHVIRSIKQVSDTQKEDVLKNTLFTMIFGEGKYQIIKDYYCATEEQWQALLGKAPKIGSQ